jgi:hypothetical protein
MRYGVNAAQPDAWRLPAEQVERRPHRTDDEVVVAVPCGLLADPGDLYAQPTAGDLGPDDVVHTERQPERVEAGADVGAGRRDPHLDGPVQPAAIGVRRAHDRPSSAAAAVTSAATVRGSGSPATATSGSLIPVPVIVQTTTEPALT